MSTTLEAAYAELTKDLPPTDWDQLSAGQPDVTERALFVVGQRYGIELTDVTSYDENKQPSTIVVMTTFDAGRGNVTEFGECDQFRDAEDAMFICPSFEDTIARVNAMMVATY